jgi:hypothetical protein
VAPRPALLLSDHGAPPPHSLPGNRRLPPPPASPRCFCLHLSVLSLLGPVPLPSRHCHPRAPLPRYVTRPDSLASLFSLHGWHGTTDLRLVSRLTRPSAQDRSCTSSAETSGACCTRGTSGGSSDAMKRGERSRIYWTRLTGIPLMCSIWTTPTATHRSTSLHAPSSLSRSVSLRHKRGCYANLCLRVMVEFTADDDLIETSFLE